TKNHLVAVAETAPDGSGFFRIDLSFGMNITEVEAVAADLLALLVKETAETGASCECCAARRDRAQMALNAIRDGLADAPLSLH
ncbi:MAG: hypothetical protein ACREEY_00380, partial [Brevundimonas sp.]